LNPEHEPIVEGCGGCKHVVSNFLFISAIECEEIKNLICDAYLCPEAKWFNGKKCPLCSTVKQEIKPIQKALDPIKASKRKMKGK